MRSYTYRIADYDIILITEDNDFGNLFYAHFANIYGPRNPKGFARVFVVQNYNDALSLISIERICIVVIDSDIGGITADTFFAQTQDKKIQQFFSYGHSPKELDETYKRIFKYETMLVLLETTIDMSFTERLPTDIQIWRLGKPVKLKEIDPLVCPTNVMRGQQIEWLRDPITRLPSGRLIEEKIKEVRNIPDQDFIFIKIAGIEQLKTNYTYSDLAEIDLFMADILEQSIDEQSNSKGWIGHSGNHFFVTTPKDYLKPVTQQVVYLFEKGIREFCFSDEDAQRLSLVFYKDWQL